MRDAQRERKLIIKIFFFQMQNEKFNVNKSNRMEL